MGRHSRADIEAIQQQCLGYRRKMKRAAAIVDIWRAGHWSGMCAGLDIIEQHINAGEPLATAIARARGDVIALFSVLVGDEDV